jgi:hypothetical protein
MLIQRCAHCGSPWETVACMKTKKPRCVSCCDVDCGYHYSCWGRYY